MWVFGVPSNFPQILNFCFLDSDGGVWGAQFAPQRKFLIDSVLASIILQTARFLTFNYSAFGHPFAVGGN